MKLLLQLFSATGRQTIRWSICHGIRWSTSPKYPLYKHFSITDNTVDSLNKESVWLSDPSSFNDPYDSSSSLLEEFMELGWEEKARDLNFTPDEIKAINVEKKIAETAKHQEDMKQLRKSLRICSFSEVNNSVLMWAHYADQHRGICVSMTLRA